MLKMHSDYRIGGVPRWYFSDEDWERMKVPDEIRKCVVFICYRKAGEIRLGGSAFFVAVGLEDTEQSAVYLITAAHVINGIAAESDDQTVYLRVNMRDGKGVQLVTIEAKHWIRHNTADVAACPLVPRQDIADYLIYPLRSAATEQVIAEEQIGVGEEVFITGLFVNHYGRQANRPIVRVGNIALMPEEKVSTRFGDIDAYLIEARSIGGLSGSPVFVHLGWLRNKDGKHKFSTSPAGVFYLLGVMQGHWESAVPRHDTLAEDLDRESVNMGIAIVVPALKIIELLDEPEFKTARDEMVKKIYEETMPVLDDTATVSGKPFTKDDFEKSLQKVSRKTTKRGPKPSRPDKSSSGT
jgi:hypothetical protein